jgi:diguanylate cyclase (GGDEF)-like protein/PAS domain S-box-containing protein
LAAKRGWHFGIKAEFLAVIAVALIPIALLGSFQIYLHERDLLDERTHEAARIAKLIAYDTEQKMQGYFTLASRLTERPEAQTESVECNALMAEFRRANLGLLGAGFIDKTGIHRCTSHAGDSAPKPTDFGDIHWFVQAQQASDPFVSQPYVGRTRKGWMLLVVAPVRSDQGQFRGTINLPLNTESLRPTLHQLFDYSASVLIVDADGRVITHATDHDAFTMGQPVGEEPGITRALNGLETTFPAVDSQGHAFLFATATIPSTGWRVITKIPASTVSQPIREEILRLALTWLITVIVSLLAALLFARHITRPIRALADLARQYPRNTPSARADPAGPRELVTLAECFNRMLDQQDRDDAQLRVAAIAFEAQEGILVTDADHRIVRVNKAFTKITGYSEQEVVGKNPRILNSGKHDRAFFREFHRRLEREGYWQGELWNRRKSGEIYPEWASVSAVKDDSGRVENYVGAFSDISERKLAEDKIHQLTNFDPLTQLPNRQLSMDRLSHTISLRARHGGHAGLMLLDLDNFKYVNEAVSHAAGDDVLRQLTTRIQAQIREVDTLARLGGDEFILIFEDLGTDDPAEAARHAEQIARKILACFNAGFTHSVEDPIAPQATAFHVSASLGIVIVDDEPIGVDRYFKQAEAAMYQAKQDKGNSLRFFDDSMQQAISRRASLEAALRLAHHEHQLVAYYQPQVDARSNILGAEVLLRWAHPQRGLISPLEFIPLAEETGLIVEIGAWVLQQTCELLVAWQARPAFRQLTLAVNVSAIQFTHPEFVDQVLGLLRDKQVPPERLELELTESLLLREPEQVRANMLRLREAGVRLSIDDFGTGYSSLSYLKRLPFSKLKIDRAFVKDIHDDPNDADIVKTITALADAFGLTVIAEGVETDEQFRYLQQFGCNEFQGYLFSQPVPLEEFEKRVQGLAQ